MNVKATKTGFHNKLIKAGEEFDYDVKIREDGSNNLGKWMELTAEGQKDFNKAQRAFDKKQASKPELKES